MKNQFSGESAVVVMKTLRVVAALTFVLALAFVLAKPILDAKGEVGSHSPGAAPTRGGATPSPSPSEQEATRPIALASPYPERCLDSVDPPSGVGLVAAYRGGRVAIGSPLGEVSGRIKAQSPLQWSPSGRFLATGEGALFRADGTEVATLRPNAEWWVWSPVADCLLVSWSGEVFVWTPGKGVTEVPLVDEVEEVAFERNGWLLGYLRVGDAGNEIWIADLRRSMTRLEIVRSEPAVRLMGWDSGESKSLLYLAAHGESVLADGGFLRWVSHFGVENFRISRKRIHGGFSVELLPYQDFILPCHGNLLVVHGLGRDASQRKQLSHVPYDTRGPFGPGAQPTTPRKFAYVSGACSQRWDSLDSAYIAAIRQPAGASVDDRRLVVVRSDGSFVSAPTDGDGYADEYARWGRSGTGVLFVRRPLEGGPPEVWFIPEGRTPVSSSLKLEKLDDYFGHFSWWPIMDWSADAPSGQAP